eukprot:6050637-Pyramimonas_sp.AAC.1
MQGPSPSKRSESRVLAAARVPAWAAPLSAAEFNDDYEVRPTRGGRGEFERVRAVALGSVQPEGQLPGEQREPREGQVAGVERVPPFEQVPGFGGQLRDHSEQRAQG